MLAIGTSKGNATNWTKEDGSRPSVNNIKKLARELEVSVEVLVDAICDEIDESFFELEENAPGRNKTASITGKPLNKVECLNDDFHCMLPDQLATANTVLVRYDYNDHFNKIRPGDYIIVDQSVDKPEVGKMYLFFHDERYELLTYGIASRSPRKYTLATESEMDRGIEQHMTPEEVEDALSNMELVGRPLWAISKRLLFID